jgi:hypothetical protein
MLDGCSWNRCCATGSGHEGEGGNSVDSVAILSWVSMNTMMLMGLARMTRPKVSARIEGIETECMLKASVLNFWKMKLEKRFRCRVVSFGGKEFRKIRRYIGNFKTDHFALSTKVTGSYQQFLPQYEMHVNDSSNLGHGGEHD